MNITQEKVSVELPRPVVQRKASSFSSIWEIKHDFKDEVTVTKLKKYLLAEVDEKRAVFPMAGYCFMTGVVCVHIFFFHHVSDPMFLSAMLLYFQQFLSGVAHRQGILCKYEHFHTPPRSPN
jgi:hypothetical protein